MSAIKVGDLVQVVRPRDICGCFEDAGKIFKVGYLQSSLAWRCGNCGLIGEKERVVAFGSGVSRGIHRLKRIPPLSELERDTEKLKETA